MVLVAVMGCNGPAAVPISAQSRPEHARGAERSDRIKPVYCSTIFDFYFIGCSASILDIVSRS